MKITKLIWELLKILFRDGNIPTEGSCRHDEGGYITFRIESVDVSYEQNGSLYVSLNEE
jgi:hypothetical protein